MKAKALVLFSGGLDSMLAARLLQEHGIGVEGINIQTPFYTEYGRVKGSAESLGIRLHSMRAGPEYFRILAGPKHGYGANMNPCVDCRIYMYREAARLAKDISADFIATGEVLGERPFSQTRGKLLLMEREAGLEGRVVRPLSGKLLPPTGAEKRGLVSRGWLLDIRGRSRRRQLSLARGFGIRDFPSPAGGCLLTDPAYSGRLRDLLEHGESVGWKEAESLKLGRHFRLQGKKVVVGRNEGENLRLLGMAREHGLGWLEVKGSPGPVTLIMEQKVPLPVVILAASLTARYSDSRGEAEVELCTKEKRQAMLVRPLSDAEARKLMV